MSCKSHVRITSLIWDCPSQIMLHVPTSIREVERLEEEKHQELLSSLSNAGVDLVQVPKEELKNGDGEVLTALKCWHSYLGRLQKTGNHKCADEMDNLC
eukprot:9947735-Ditylum_brightwellii.AAC.1